MTQRKYKKEIARIVKERDELLNNLSKAKFNSRRHMLFTLKIAYRHVLDNMMSDKSKKRLTEEQEFDLGTRLSKYWDVKK